MNPIRAAGPGLEAIIGRAGMMNPAGRRLIIMAASIGQAVRTARPIGRCELHTLQGNDSRARAASDSGDFVASRQ